MRASYKCRAVITILCAYTVFPLYAQTGFYADIATLYLSNTLEGAAKDAVQGVEPAFNLGYRFLDTLGAGLFTNISLGFYSIVGDISEHSDDIKQYTRKIVSEYPVWRFDVQPYLFLVKPLTYWVEFGVGIGPEISVYQYMFNSVRNGSSHREMIGTQEFGIGIMPQIQFTIYEHIIFGFRIHWVPFTLTGRSVYGYYFTGKEKYGYQSVERKGLEVQNHFVKFGVFAGYRFGRTYYRSNYEYRR
jgi:hypothetical protein